MNMTLDNDKTKVILLAEKEEDTYRGSFGDRVELTTEYGNPISTGQLASVDVISLFIRNAKWGEDTVRNIKTQPDLFLKPLITLSEFQLDGLNEIVDDGIILPVEGDVLDSRIEKLLTISQRIENLTSIPDGSGDEKFKEILILRYLLTRNGSTLNPVRNLSSRLGYTYPPVQLLLNVGPGEEIDLMEGLEEAYLLKGTLSDKMHICPYCRHFQINFRETCPDCHSIKVNEEKTIHHYRCAYVGQEKDFMQGNDLQCPKCGRKIRHIGVDYDRPAANLWCDECGSNFSEPCVTCFCLSCGKTFEPDYALPKLVKAYSLTKEGEQVAKEGILPETRFSEILKKEFGFYKLELFKEILRLEVERCIRNDFDSTLVRVAIKNFHQAIAEGGIVHAKKLREKLANLFKDMLRESDILTDLDDDAILVILTHTNTEQAKIALDRIRERSGRYFTKNVDIEYNFLPIRDQNSDVDEILDNI